MLAPWWLVTIGIVTGLVTRTIVGGKAYGTVGDALLGVTGAFSVSWMLETLAHTHTLVSWSNSTLFTIWGAAALPLLAPMPAHAQSGLDAQCPNASATLNSVTFPLDLPAETKTGDVVVEFTIGANGAITDATAVPSSDPAFASPAVAAVKRLSCNARPAPQRFSLPVSFSKPEAISSSLCSNYPYVLQGLEFPRSLSQSGVRRADLVLEFTLQASGRASESRSGVRPYCAK